MAKEKKQTYRSDTNSITVIRPSKTRKTFSLRLEIITDGIKSYDCKIFKKNETLLSINTHYKNGLFDFNHATHLVEKLKMDLAETHCKVSDDIEEVLEISKVNMRLFNSYWKDIYEDKDVKNRSANIARKQFMRVLRVFGDVSLVGSSKKEIKATWERFNNITYASKVRLSSRANALLKKGNRDFILRMKKRDRQFVDDKTQISEDDLIFMLPEVYQIQDYHAARICFYLGLRNGELYGLKKTDFKKNKSLLLIRRQLVRGEGFHDDCKSDSARDLPVPKHLHESLEAWLELPFKYKKEDDKRFGARLKTLSRNAFPKDEIKHVSPHGLRRSFAKHYYSSGFDISDLAMLMGDTEEVVRDSYLGLKLSDRMLNTLQDKMNNM